MDKPRTRRQFLKAGASLGAAFGLPYQGYPFDSTTHYKWGLISLA